MKKRDKNYQKNSACRSFFFTEKELVNLPAGKAGLKFMKPKKIIEKTAASLLILNS
jgi:hypothetical protein